MALSDKHEGKILVPWFNSHEWKYVYQLIYSESSNTTTKKEALGIIKIWKARMPLLSSGIEGTLIVLNALLMEAESMTEENVCLLYATSIMRFLNLCAANNKKQGTFYETARKNELPDWLINIRHDLAHDQKVPSKFMLLHSLNFCLEWLKGKYWEVQEELVVDFVAPKAGEENVDVLRYAQLCCRIVAEIRKKKAQTLNNLSSYFIKQLKNFVRSNQIHKDTSVIDVIQLLCDTFIKLIDDTSQDEILKCISEELLSSENILTWTQQETKSLSSCASNTYQVWGVILQSLNDNTLLPPLIDILINYTINENNDDAARQYAGMWLNEIFEAFLEESDSDSNRIRLRNYDAALREFQNFRTKILTDPNIHTLIFLKSLLTICGYTEESIKEVISVVTNYTKVVDEHMEIDNEIYQVIHTAAEVMPISNNVTVSEPSVINNTYHKLTDVVKEVKYQKNKDVPKGKWELVKDTSIFLGCPLGVLPNQSRIRNPLLDFRTV